MTRLESRARLFACLLSALAGFVDAMGFIRSGGFFVSFMSGNSTRLAVGGVRAWHDAGVAGGLILCFLAGVVGGALLGSRFDRRRPAAVLLLIAALLAAAALLEFRGAFAVALALLAFAMGAENAVFEQGGEVRIGLTYMTGSLVRVGNGIAGAILGRGGRSGWFGYLMLWLGFVAGAVLGALSYGSGNSATLWAASGVALALAFAALRLFEPADLTSG
jgi:uncharacterized membrane protein YoaK (UPF0700 family)